MKKKVTYVITKSNWGGAQRYVFDLATALSPEKFEVSVACGGSGMLVQKLKKKGVRTIEVKSFQRDISFGKDARSVSELVKIFKQEKPDVVHLNSSKAGGIGALAAKIAGVPKIIFTVHGVPWDEDRNPISKFLIYMASQATFAMCDEVITVSKDNHARVPGSKLIYNGVAYMTFGSGEVIRKAFPPGVPITGTIGELTHNKNQIALLVAARENPAMYVAIVGEGELREMLEAKIREWGLSARVKLFGFMPAAEVLKGFDVFALPSLKEGLPYVLLEAKLAGLPIEATRVGGIGEILDGTPADFSLEKMVRETVKLY
ncbi:glycosyltransferase [Candidatus Parcubacteria bacterium]|nr:glycosyltransferase [Candidatus Parcubacteria bacterium]